MAKKRKAEAAAKRKRRGQPGADARASRPPIIQTLHSKTSTEALEYMREVIASQHEAEGE
jgi:hypothetical protein